MQFHDFLGQVQHRAKLATLEEALRATRAALETLAERVRNPKNLAAQLPREIAEFLKPNDLKEMDRFSAQEFLARVGRREGVDPPDAAYHVRVVLGGFGGGGHAWRSGPAPHPAAGGLSTAVRGRQRGADVPALAPHPAPRSSAHRPVPFTLPRGQTTEVGRGDQLQLAPLRSDFSDSRSGASHSMGS